MRIEPVIDRTNRLGRGCSEIRTEGGDVLEKVIVGNPDSNNRLLGLSVPGHPETTGLLADVKIGQGILGDNGRGLHAFAEHDAAYISYVGSPYVARAAEAWTMRDWEPFDIARHSLRLPAPEQLAWGLDFKSPDYTFVAQHPDAVGFMNVLFDTQPTALLSWHQTALGKGGTFYFGKEPSLNLVSGLNRLTKQFGIPLNLQRQDVGEVQSGYQKSKTLATTRLADFLQPGMDVGHGGSEADFLDRNLPSTPLVLTEMTLLDVVALDPWMFQGKTRGEAGRQGRSGPLNFFRAHENLVKDCLGNRNDALARSVRHWSKLFSEHDSPHGGPRIDDPDEQISTDEAFNRLVYEPFYSYVLLGMSCELVSQERGMNSPAARAMDAGLRCGLDAIFSGVTIHARCPQTMANIMAGAAATTFAESIGVSASQLFPGLELGRTAAMESHSQLVHVE